MMILHDRRLRISHAKEAGLRNRLVRARYFRGHGVHSPFVYDLVREVFMRHKALSGERGLMQTLTQECSCSSHTALQLQNLATHCGYTTFAVNRSDADLCILTADLSEESTRRLLNEAAAQHHTAVLLHPYLNRTRRDFCVAVISAHTSTTVDKLHYLLIFNNHLPKQHFQL